MRDQCLRVYPVGAGRSRPPRFCADANEVHLRSFVAGSEGLGAVKGQPRVPVGAEPPTTRLHPRDPQPPTAGLGAVNPGTDPGPVTTYVTERHVRTASTDRDRREAGLTVLGPALSIRPSRGWRLRRKWPAVRTLCMVVPSCWFRAWPTASARPSQSGAAAHRPRASSARATARQGGLKPYRKFSPAPRPGTSAIPRLGCV